MQKPDEYHFLDNSRPSEKSYVYDVADVYDDDTEALRLSFKIDGSEESCVTFFPKKAGLEMTAADTPSYEQGNNRALFGLVAMHIIRAGETILVEK